MAEASNVEFSEWARRWMDLANFKGPELPDEERRIEDVVALWNKPIRPEWLRGRDDFLIRAPRYRRGKNAGEAHIPRGEYVIEREVLKPSPRRVRTCCLGARLVDGVNAVPLAKGRKVEADMLLLVGDEHSSYGLQLVEAKDGDHNAWYAAVQNLRQLRLYLKSPEIQRLFHQRCPDLDLPQGLPVTAVVLARPRHEFYTAPGKSFYTAPGKRMKSVAPAKRLLKRMRPVTGVDMLLATWDTDARVIGAW